MEMVATLGVIAVISGIAVSNLSVLERPLYSASNNLTHYFRLVRARAISQTRSIKVTSSGARRITAGSGKNCAVSSFTPEPSLTLQLDKDVSFGSSPWSICFNQRGLADSYVEFTISSGKTVKSVEIALGGGIRIR